MKNLLTVILSCSMLFVMNSCYKTPGVDHRPPAADSATTRLLTSQTWVYYEYFEFFDSVHATLVWKRSPLVDSINLSLNQVKFNSDGTYSEITQTGSTLTGTWSYINDGTGTQVVNSQGTFTSTIKSLTGQRYEWLAPGGTYGVMVPLNQTIDSAGGRMALITSHPWVYQEYFYNFNQGVAVPSLVWKSDLPDAQLNLSQNVVKFNADSTYLEIDQNGVTYNGTWSFTGNQTGTVVNNSLGTFSATIERLDTARFEWYDGVNHYGEMVPQ